METIGLSNESPDEMRKMKAPAVHFFAGTDTQSRTFLSYEITAVPHLVLIDPKGIVRFEGPPIYLDEKNLAHLLDEYALIKFLAGNPLHSSFSPGRNSENSPAFRRLVIFPHLFLM